MLLQNFDRVFLGGQDMFAGFLAFVFGGFASMCLSMCIRISKNCLRFWECLGISTAAATSPFNKPFSVEVLIYIENYPTTSLFLLLKP